MKKHLLFALFITLTTLAAGAQTPAWYPIPSFQIPVDSACYACFREIAHTGAPGKSLEKQDVHIRIINNAPETPGCQATVWLYSLDGLDVLGPYTVQCGDELVVTVDDREWGVIVSTQYDVTVDVWIE